MVVFLFFHLADDVQGVYHQHCAGLWSEDDDGAALEAVPAAVASSPLIYSRIALLTPAGETRVKQVKNSKQEIMYTVCVATKKTSFVLNIQT